MNEWNGKPPHYVMRKMGPRSGDSGPSSADFFANTIMRIFSDFEGELFYNGYKFIEDGQPETAILYFEDMLFNKAHLAPSREDLRAICFTGKGMALNALEKNDEAIEYLKKAFAINKRNILAALFTGAALASSQYYEEAANWYDLALEIRENNDYECALIMPYNIVSEKAAALAEGGYLDDAIEALDYHASIADHFMDGPRALRARGHYRSIAGKWEGALEDFSHLFKTDKSPEVSSVLAEALIMVGNNGEVHHILDEMNRAMIDHEGYGVVAEYFDCLSLALDKDLDTAVKNAVMMTWNRPPPRMEWDFKPINKHVKSGLGEAGMDFFKAMQDWITGKEKRDHILNLAKDLGIDVIMEAKNLPKLDLTEIKRITTLMHEEIMNIPHRVTDEEYKIQCTVIGDHMEYRGIAHDKRWPQALMILFTSPRIYRHPDEAQGFEETKSYKEMYVIDEAICEIWFRYREFLKGRASLEMMGGTSAEKVWLHPKGKRWTYSDLVPKDQQDMLTKLLGPRPF
ncbi:MAG: hypothetical protein ACFFCS_12070 [Candidatus Hodarchaeota archaeon]